MQTKTCAWQPWTVTTCWIIDFTTLVCIWIWAICLQMRRRVTARCRWCQTQGQLGALNMRVWNISGLFSIGVLFPFKALIFSSPTYGGAAHRMPKAGGIQLCTLQGPKSYDEVIWKMASCRSFFNLFVWLLRAFSLPMKPLWELFQVTTCFSHSDESTTLVPR